MRVVTTLFVLCISLVAHSGESESPDGSDWVQAPIKGNCKESYVPPHSMDELEEVKNWATGRAFLIFAEKAGYEFDGETYGEDNPYPALFNFGLATATTCLVSDVTTYYLSMFTHLAKVYKKLNDGTEASKQRFQEIYLKLATAYGMDVYLTPLDEEQSFKLYTSQL